MSISGEEITRLASLELNALNASGVMPEVLERGRVRSAGTQVFDIDGTLLFHRVPIFRGRESIGYADVAANEVLREPLLAVSTGAAWEEKSILEEGVAAARRKRRGLKFDSVRFVAYSFPKIGLQFLKDDREVMLLEWRTWAEVPPAPTELERRPMEPSNFERWSLLDELPANTRRANVRSFRKRLSVWDAPVLRRYDPRVIDRSKFVDLVTVKLVDTREVHYSPRPDDHHVCYELRGQQTNVWCVAASVEMLLNFYRYQYDQPRLAEELVLGTCDDPNGLPYGDEWRVVSVVEKLSSNTLDATSIADPAWTTFTTEIQANRPLISFIPGHSRTVAGYVRYLITLPGQLPFRGLLVFDPWPPTDCAHPEAGGVVTRWENFATHTYRYAFSAMLKHV